MNMNFCWASLTVAAGFSLLLGCRAVNFECGPEFQTGSFTYVQNILLVHNVGNASGTQSGLTSTGAFAKVDVFDASNAIPTPELLRTYHAVLVMASGFSDFQSEIDLGDLLADYWNAGGIVVLLHSAFAEENVQGAFGNFADGYKLITSTQFSAISDADSLGVVAEPTSPIMAGVVTLNAVNAWRSDAPTIFGGSVVVASWGKGQPLAIRGRKNNRNLVTLNIYGVRSSESVSSWTGDGMTLFRNALLFSACGKATLTAQDVLC
jgi:hypothetical protein